MKSPDLWGPAIKAELVVMEEKGVWVLIDKAEVPARKKIAELMWVFANKFNSEGEITKQKAQFGAPRGNPPSLSPLWKLNTWP